MLLLCFVAGAWADEESSGNQGTADAAIVGTSYSLDGKFIAGKGGRMQGNMPDKGVKLRTNKGAWVFAVNAGYRIDKFEFWGCSNDGNTVDIASATVDGGDNLLASAVTVPAKDGSTSADITLTDITARDNITLDFANGSSQIVGTWKITYTQEQVILQEITDVTLNGASIGETALATLKADKAVTIDGSSLNGIGILDVTLSSGATTVNRAFDGNNVVYTFTTNGGADAYTVTVTGVKKTYAAAQGTVVYYNEDALSNGKKTLTVDGVAFNYPSKEFGYANNTAGVTLGETTYKPIKLSTGEAVSVTFPEGKKATKIIVYGWSAGGLGTGKLVNFTDGGEKSVDTSNDIFYANDGSGSVYPSVYEYEVDNWEAFTFQGNGDQPFVVMDFVFASEAPATKYTIGKTILPEGAATFNLTVTEAAAGEEVTATIDPTSVTFADGWGWNNINEHSLVSLKTESGVDVPFTINDATRSATFTMPAENVIATFQLFPEYEVSLVQAENGTYKVDGHEAGTGMKRYEGEVSEFTEIVPDFGYKLGTITVTAEDGTDVPVADYKFTMPAQKVTVTVTFVPEPVNLTVTMSDGGDLTAAIESTKASLAPEAPIKSLTITLAEGNYTVSAPIEASGNITINGNGATIDASGLLDGEGQPVNMIQWTNIDAAAEWMNGSVSIDGLTVKGLQKALFYSNSKYYTGDFSINNCIVEQAGDATTIDFTKGSVAIDIDVTNSTFYAPTATTKSFYSSQSGQKATEYSSAAIQTFHFENNTMYNLAKGKNFFSHRQSNQTWLAYDVLGNIFVNCGKSGQVIKGMNGGQGGPNPTWNVDGNAFNFDGADTSAAETTGDDAEPVQNSVAGVFAFDDAATGDFNGIFKGTAAEAPAKYPGDPRWTYTYEIAPTDIVINPEDITDGNITAALAAKKEGVAKIGNITITLDGAASYTITEPIEGPGAISIIGQGATVDASGLTGNGLVQWTNVAEPTEWTLADVSFTGLTVNGLSKALFYSNGKNYCASNFLIDNCIVEQAGDATTIDFTKGSTALDIVVMNSTFYAPTATTKAFYSSQSGQKAIEYDASAIQTFRFLSNTMYNLTPNKNFFSHRQNSQTWLHYDIEDNVFVNCGKSGQVIKGFNGGGSSANPTWLVYTNIFNFGGADTSASESTGDEAEPIKNSVSAVVTFTDAANGDFNGSVVIAGEAPLTVVGDPRWTLTRATGYNITISDEIANGTVTADKAFAAEGDEITLTITPAEGYELDAISVTGVTSDIAVIVTDGKFTMPADAVSVNATFKVATPTGISSIENGQLTIDNDAPAYNLAGQKVGKGYKGIVIKSGRKVVMK